MNIGIVIASNDPETAWNAFRLAVFALDKKGHCKSLSFRQGCGNTGYYTRAL